MPRLGQQVGKVSIKVVPDTRDFRRELKNKIEAIEPTLPKVEIQTKVNMVGAERDMLDGVRRINAANRASEARKVKLKTALDTTNMRTSIAQALRKIQGQVKNDERLFFKADVAATLIEGELNKESFKSARKWIKDWRDGFSPLYVDIKPQIVEGTGAVVAARLATLTRPRTVSIVPVLDTSAAAKVTALLGFITGGRLIKQSFTDVFDLIKNMDKAIVKVTALGLGFLTLSGYVLAAMSNIFTFTSGIVQMGQAALALPGILGGIAIGLGITIAALKDFNKVIPGVGKRFKKLQDQISSNFWDKARKPMKEMIDQLFPKFAAGARQAATELGGFFGALSTSLTAQFDTALAQMFDDLSKSIAIATEYTDDFAKILRVLGESGAARLPQLARWFGDINRQFGNFLANAQADGSLDRWIDNGIKQMKDFGRVIANTSSILAGLARAAEAAGGSTLAKTADTLERVAKVVNGEKFSSALTDVLRAAHQSMSLISSQSGPAFQSMMETLARGLTKTLPDAGAAVGKVFREIFLLLESKPVASGLTALFDGMARGATNAAPMIKNLAKPLGAILRLTGKLAEEMLPTLATAFSAVAPGVTKAVSALTPLVEKAGPILRKVFTDLKPVFSAVGDAIAKIAPKVGKLIDAFGRLWEQIGPVLVPILKTLASILGSVIGGAIDGITKFIDGITRMVEGIKQVFEGFKSGDIGMIFSGLGDILMGALGAAFGAVMTYLNVTILGGVRAFFTKKFAGAFKELNITSILTGIVSKISGFGGKIIGAFKKLFNPATLRDIGYRAALALVNSINVISKIVGFVSRTFRAVVGFIRGGIALGRAAVGVGFQAMVGLASRALSAMMGAVSSGIGRVLGFLRSVPGKIKGVFKGAASLLLNVGQSIVSGLAAGIRGAWSIVSGAINSLIAKIPAAIKKLLGINSPSKVTRDIAKGIPEGMAQGIRMRGRLVDNAIETLIKRVVNKGVDGLAGLSKRVRARLEPTAKAIVAVMRQIEAAKKQADEYAKQVTENIVKTGDVTASEDRSFEGIIDTLTTARDNAIRLAQLIRSLAKAGLNRDAIAQIVAAAPEAGVEIAESILQAGAAGIQQINDLQNAIRKSASQVGREAADIQYGLGQHMGDGLLKGLMSKKDALIRALRRIAKEMQDQIRKDWKMHSPSRVAMRMGAFVGEGFALGATSALANAFQALSSLSLGDGFSAVGAGAIDSLAAGMESRYSVVRRSLEGLAGDMQDVDLSSTPLTQGVKVAAKVSGALDDEAQAPVVVKKVFNYHAAPGSSLGSEEDLFAAVGRARFGDF